MTAWRVTQCGEISRYNAKSAPELGIPLDGKSDAKGWERDFCLARLKSYVSLSVDHELGTDPVQRAGDKNDFG